MNYSFIQFDTDFTGQIEFPEFCNMMSAKMGTVNDEDMIRMAFRVLDKDGSGTIKSSAFKHLMTHIGKAKCMLLQQCSYLTNQFLFAFCIVVNAVL